MDKYIVDDFKNKINDIETPKVADEIIRRAMERGDKKRKLKYIKPLTTAAAVIIISIICAANSPAFASYLGNIPVIKTIFGLENKGVENAIKNGFVQKPNKDLPACGQEVTCKDITITIDGLMISGNKLNLAYTLKAGDSQKDLKGLNICNYEIIDDAGKILYKGEESNLDSDNIKNIKDRTEFNGMGMTGEIYPDNSEFQKDKTAKGSFEFISDETKVQIPKSITFKVTQLSEDIREDKYSGFSKKYNRLPQVINGDWTINIKLDEKFIDAKTISYKPAQPIKDGLIKFEYINLYPTVANGKFYVAKNLNIAVTGVYLEDEKGNVYKNTEYGIFGNDQAEHKMNFESPYFDKPQKLYLVIKDAELRDSKKKVSYKIELVKMDK